MPDSQPAANEPAASGWKTSRRWLPVDLVIFDCDSTLSTIEGIDELARLAGREEEVAELTARAMDGEIPLQDVYGKRLELLQPTREQLQRVSWLYRQTIVPGAEETIAALQALGMKVFVVSGGLLEPVRDFAITLGVPAEHVFAVNVAFDQLAGKWWEYWKQGGSTSDRYVAYDHGPLTMAQGKAAVLDNIRQAHRGRALMVGDGITDLEASSVVDYFVGFGGVEKRETVAEKAGIYIIENNLTPIVPLAGGTASIPPGHEETFKQGVKLIQEGAITFNPPGQKDVLLRDLKG